MWTIHLNAPFRLKNFATLGAPMNGLPRMSSAIFTKAEPSDGKGNRYQNEKQNVRSFEELCGILGKEEDREDIARMVAAIHEGRLLGTERESL